MSILQTQNVISNNTLLANTITVGGVYMNSTSITIAGGTALAFPVATSIFGGAGGNTSIGPSIPGGGGGSIFSQSGARGELRVWVIR